MINALLGSGIAVLLMLGVVAWGMYALGSGDTARERFRWWLR